MNIAIIARTYKAVPDDGISRFTFEVINRLVANNPGHHFTLIFDRKPDNTLHLPENCKIGFLKPAARHPFLWYYWNEWRLPRLLKASGADLVLYPDGIMSLSSKIPGIPVIHDISFYHRPGDTPFLTSLYYRYFFRKFAAKAVRISTVSQFCREDISTFLGIDPGLIDVAYNGVSEYFSPLDESETVRFRRKLTGGSPYFLFVGNFSPRKNIPGVIRAFNRFRMKTEFKYKLVLTGGRLFLNSETDRLIKESPWSDDIIVPGPAIHKDLRYYYSAALALVFVPWFEGFGIPAAEAMRCGTPVILSRTTSLPEVGGIGSLFVDPGNTDDICDAMIRISEDNDLRISLSERGRKQSLKFNWDNTANSIWESIIKAAEHKSDA